MCDILKTSFEDAILPASWRLAHVTPIFKKGDKFNPENYRPISVSSSVRKLLERIIVKNLLPFLFENNIIPEHQHGFLPGRSVLTNMLYATNIWTKAIDNSVPVDVIYLDFSRAFDKVPINRLLLKLEHFGIRGTLLRWIKSYLSDLHFQVRSGDSFSQPRVVYSGVPQGSVLGPLLFLIYVADLPNSIRSQYCMYADDTKIFNYPLIDRHALQQDLDNIYSWTTTWLLPLNIEKTIILHIGRNNPKHVYMINGIPLSPVDVHVDLGITITSALGWSEQVLRCVKRAGFMLYLITKSFYRPTPDLMLKLYTAYIRPHLEFSVGVWSPFLQGDIKLLESIQRRATRLPTAFKNVSYNERLQRLGIPSLENRRRRGDLINMFRCVTSNFNCDMSDLYVLNVDNRLRGHKFKLCREKFKKNVRANFLTNRVFSDWNSLPSNVINATSINIFKNGLDAFWSI